MSTGNAKPAVRTIHAAQSHFGWDNSIGPVAEVEPGTDLELELSDASGLQLTEASSAEELMNLDFAKVNPVTGPVYVAGAEPGDAIKIIFNGFEPSVGWGWTAIIPGFGLLTEDFPEPALHIWRYSSLSGNAEFANHASIPLRPFAGTVGLAPAEPGLHSVVPPRRVGGNLDMRDLFAGTVLLLPVEVPGGLFSIGDSHAAQGDGEVCGTAIETAMKVQLNLDVVKGANITAPQFETSSPVTRHLDEKGYFVTTGVGPDLMQNARDAVRAMIDLLQARTSMSAQDAYMLCSVTADLRIPEIVDAPNWIVACYFPKKVLEA